MQNAILNVNGQILKPEHAKVSVFDRGFLYGDSLYEVARTYGGKLFLLREHLERMAKSAELARMVLGQPLEQYAREMERAVAEFHRQPGMAGREAYCRIIVTRGLGRIGFGLSCLETTTQYVIIAAPLEEPTDEQIRKGFHLQVSSRLRNDRRALDPAMKSGNYLNSLLAYLEAAAGDYDDAILCNADGHVTEGTTFNVGYIRRGILATPPLDIGILDGLTRRHLLAICAETGVPAREARFPKERMYEADEVFLLSTIKEVFPVTRLDGREIGDGSPGKLTLKLREAFRKRALGTTR